MEGSGALTFPSHSVVVISHDFTIKDLQRLTPYAPVTSQYSVVSAIENHWVRIEYRASLLTALPKKGTKRKNRVPFDGATTFKLT